MASETDVLPDVVAPPANRNLPRLFQLLPAFESFDYRLLWSSSLFSFAGWWMVQLALGWLVLELTNSPFQLGLVSFFAVIPQLVFSIPGGVLADRIDRRQLILVTQIGTFLLVGLLAGLVLGDAARLEIIYLITLLTGVLMSINMPARQSLAVEVVRRDIILSAVALNSAVFNVTRIVGPIVAGLLLTYVSIGGTLLVGAVCYFLVIIAVSAVRYRKVPSLKPPTSAWRNLVDGLQYAVRQRTIFWILIMMAVPTFCIAPYMSLMPAFARDVLGLDPAGLGLLNAAIGVGALGVTTYLAVAGNRIRHKGWLLLGSGLATALLLIAFTMVRSVPISLFLLVLIGITNFGQLTLSNSIMQMIVPNELRGRILSLYMLLWGLMPIGTLVLSAVAEVRGTPFALALGGVVAIVLMIPMSIRAAEIRRLD